MWEGLAASAAGAGLGMISQGLGIGSKRQMKQQKEMNEHSMALNYKYGSMAANTAYERQKEMYERSYKDESPEAKRKQLEEAGMSVGLMYGNPGGMGGAGQASTAQKAETGQASPGQAMNPADGANAITNSARMGIEVARQQAEIENIKSQTEKNKAETSQAGANTENIGTQTKLNLENITNAKLKGEAMQWENKQTKIQTEIAESTKENKIELIAQGLEKLTAETDALIVQIDKEKVELDIKKQTKQAIVDIAYTNVDLMISQIYKNMSETQKNKIETKIAPILAELKGMGLQIDNGKLEVYKTEIQNLKEYQNDKINQGYNGMIANLLEGYIGIVSRAAR